ncbi:hypothetical protein D3C77_629030 [compost metagenome]
MTILPDDFPLDLVYSVLEFVIKGSCHYIAINLHFLYINGSDISCQFKGTQWLDRCIEFHLNLLDSGCYDLILFGVGGG